MQALQDLEMSVFCISVYSHDGSWIIGQTSLDKKVIWDAATAGKELSGIVELTGLCLAPGDYKVALGSTQRIYQFAMHSRIFVSTFQYGHVDQHGVKLNTLAAGK